MATAALLWAWSDEQTLTERFRTARKITICLLGGQQQLAKTYQAFTKILRRWTDGLVSMLQAALHQRMQQVLPGCWQVSGFILFGIDGSRIELPRTRSHEQAYSSIRHRRRRGKRRCARALAAKDVLKSNSPQLWLTTMWQPQRLSFAQLLLAFRRTLRDYLHPTEQGQRLCERTRQAIIDPYQRKNKTSRHHPRKKKESPPRPPTILIGKPWQVQRAKYIETEQSLGLTA